MSKEKVEKAINRVDEYFKSGDYKQTFGKDAVIKHIYYASELNKMFGKSIPSILYWDRLRPSVLGVIELDYGFCPLSAFFRRGYFISRDLVGRGASFESALQALEQDVEILIEQSLVPSRRVVNAFDEKGNRIRYKRRLGGYRNRHSAVVAIYEQ